jgi:electron transfer flavoprotein alpha subunit
MPILIIAEHDNKSIKDATLNTVKAAQDIGGDITILVAGSGCDDAASAAAQIGGVSKVLKADDAALEHYLAENMAPMIADAVKSGGYTHVLVPGTTFGKNIMPRIAALLDVQQLTDIIAVEGADTFKRPIYGGQAIATVKSNDSVKLLTVRATAFDKADASGGSASVEDLGGASDSGLSSFVGQELSQSERPELTSAGIVVSGGRGVGSGDDFDLIEKLADKLGAAVGASRAAVDAGYISNDHQVGQTGKAVAPDLYVAVGISGAIQHLAGMKDSKVIVAINKDEDAPIFQVADYGLVADLFEAVPELTDKL